MTTNKDLQAARPPSQREAWTARKVTGWRAAPARLVTGLLLFLTATGLSLTFLPFSPFNQHAVLTHTLVGLVFVPLFAAFLVRHVRAWWDTPLTHIKFTGWLSGLVALVCVASGLVLTSEGVFGRSITYAWRMVHIVSTFGLILFLVPHLSAIVAREWKKRSDPGSLEVVSGIRGHARLATGVLVVTLVATGALGFAVRPPQLDNSFPADYELNPYGDAGPFAPSLATTSTGGAFDPRSLSGSEGCGTSGCHEEIYAEWLPSAHRYAALDGVFQAIQGVMAQQNGPVSTRYCAGCHDPVSLFAGTKDFGVPDLTGRHGYEEGISCLACHAIEQTDVQGNANYVMHQPERYVWEMLDGPVAKALGDFVIRTYPDHHVASLSRRMFKTPEFCAACHKQFIDESVNKVGWVQLQNQYDNWKASRWNDEGEPERTLECRECHMPLTASLDPAAGDAADFNRTADDGRHRSHRFLGANQFIPGHHDLEGGEEHTELVNRWLRGELEIPEIADRWRAGPSVPIELIAPAEVRAGDDVAVSVRLVNNKVGHDFPTGPLDIIQAWVEIVVTDDAGRTVFHTGTIDARNVIEPGTFMFKAEPVDRYGNLIDRHNLWEMVGVRFKRSLFPGAEEVAAFEFSCAGTDPAPEELPLEERARFDAPGGAGTLTVDARLNYRKVDQYLLNYAFGEDSTLTSPVTTMSTASARIRVLPVAAGTGGM
jgi:hypothetical protein